MEGRGKNESERKGVGRRQERKGEREAESQGNEKEPGPSKLQWSPRDVLQHGRMCPAKECYQSENHGASTLRNRLHLPTDTSQIHSIIWQTKRTFV